MLIAVTLGSPQLAFLAVAHGVGVDCFLSPGFVSLRGFFFPRFVPFTFRVASYVPVCASETRAVRAVAFVVE